MVHDGEGNPCRKAEGNIMSPTLTGNDGVFSWSSCSRQYLKKFLSTPQAGCLVDEPKQTGQYKYPDKLPGQIYDADTQCKWQFGAKAKLCSLGFVKDICKSLWCHRVGHRCETKFMPAAEGTVCGLTTELTQESRGFLVGKIHIHALVNKILQKPIAFPPEALNYVIRFHANSETAINPRKRNI
ncbi:hypothetical protein MC885_018674 [Smutsia gigantea]|nr:hypothetical protein MC885_018674 [Smutsia gigantea]